MLNSLFLLLPQPSMASTIQGFLSHTRESIAARVATARSQPLLGITCHHRTITLTPSKWARFGGSSWFHISKRERPYILGALCLKGVGAATTVAQGGSRERIN